VFRSALPITLSAVCLLALLAAAPAQDEKPPPKKDDEKKQEPKKKTAAEADEEYRNLFKAPETPLEFWRALQFELELGRHELAARQLRGLIDKAPDDKDLLEILDREGMSAFLRLRNIRKWSDDPAANAQAQKDVEDLIRRVSAAQKRVLADPERIARFIRNLNASEEERDYAVQQLYRAGPAAVPYLIDALREADAETRVNILYALKRLGPDAVPPILAALDIPDPALQVALIDAVQDRARTEQVFDPIQKRTVTRTTSDLPQLRQRAETDPAPYWWPLTHSSVEAVRRKATEALAQLLGVPPSKLPQAKMALTREAERYYQHQVRFLDPGNVTVWRWDGQHVVAGWPGVPTVSTSRAEQYYGLRFARQALAIDPSYEPAQVVFLSLALEKGEERAGLDQPLAKAAPEVQDLLATVNPSLVTAVLDRALTDHNLPVILGAVRALGDLAETRATLPTSSRGESGLERALYYPDRRIQMAAADTLLRLPRPPSVRGGVQEVRFPDPVTRARVVDVLRRAVAAEPAAKGRPKVIIGAQQEDFTTQAGHHLAEAGFDPVPEHTGRAVLQRLNEAADIDLVMIDANLPDPGLASLLGQLRSDINTGLLPVVVLVAPEREEHLRPVTEHYRNVHLSPPGLALDTGNQKRILPVLITEAMGKPLDGAELKAYADKSAAWLARLAQGAPPGYDIRPAGDAVLDALRSGKLSKDGQLAAVEAAGRLPVPRAQHELAAVLIDPNRDPAVRDAAAQQLVRAIQQRGPVLAANEVQALQGVYAAGSTDPALRARIALVMGSLRPSARATGERLEGFQPPPPSPSAAPKEEKKEEKSGDKEEKKGDKEKKGEKEEKQ
jgi:CheY-like chemotaxis protein